MASAPFRLMGSESTETYACTSCGNGNYTVIRPDASNPRLKCSGCSFVYNGADSVAAQKAGAIGSSSESTLATAGEPERETLGERRVQIESQSVGASAPALAFEHTNVPARAKYVFVAQRGAKAPTTAGVEFCTAKEVKRVALKWHGVHHKVYELTPKSFDVKVEIN